MIEAKVRISAGPQNIDLVKLLIANRYLLSRDETFLKVFVVRWQQKKYVMVVFVLKTALFIVI